MASRTQELPAHVASRCVRSALDQKIISAHKQGDQMEVEEGATRSTAFLNAILVIVAELDMLPLTEKQLGMLMLSCRTTYVAFLESKIWVARLGYVVKYPEPALAQFRVFLVLRENISNGTWQEASLIRAGTFCSGRQYAQEVNEKVTAKELTPLVVPVDGSQSVEFWLNNLVETLKIPNYPTADQAEQVETAISTLVQKGAASMDIVKAATSVTKANKVLVCVLVKEFFKKRTAGDSEGAAEAVSASSREGWMAVAGLLRSVEMVLHACQLLLGCDVASLKDNRREALPRFGRRRGRGAMIGMLGRWPQLPGRQTNDKWLKGNYPAAFKRAVVHALGGMSWMQLSQCFAATRRGKVKAVFRNMHITSVVLGEIRGIERAAEPTPASEALLANRRRYFAAASENAELLGGMRRVYLLAAMVREDKYPASAEEFEDKAWASNIVGPLTKMVEDPMFEIDAAWLGERFSEELAGKRLPHPFRNTVECVLARDGCTTEAWEKLFRSAAGGLLTVNHVFANIRSLLLIDFEPTVVDEFLQAAVDRNQVGWVQALKGLLTIQHSLSPAEVAKLQRGIANVVDTEGGGDEGGDLVRLPMKRTFKDKKGNVTEQKKHKSVARSFGAGSVAQYREMLAKAVGSALDGAVAAAEEAAEAQHRAEASANMEEEPAAAAEEREGGAAAMEEEATEVAAAAVKRGERGAVLLLTPEMELNVTRSGVPPSIPDFSRTSLWRNEAVSLAQVAGPGEEVEKLLVGITWTPKQQHGMVLDLSVMLYDSDWNYVDECSWEKLESEGLKHSGDWCGQLGTLQSLGKKGEGVARETIEIDVKALRARAPYVATLPGARREMDDDEEAEGEGRAPGGAVGKVRYVAVGSFAYSGNDIEDFEAAAYVANPAVRGSGPGGMAVLTAQKLTGKGRVNVGILLDLYHPEGGVVAVNVDHTLGVTSKNSASRAFPEVREECRKVLQGLEGGVRLSSLGMLFGAAMTGKVVVVHGGEKAPGEGRLVAEGGGLVWSGLDTGARGVRVGEVGVGEERAWQQAEAALAARRSGGGGGEAMAMERSGAEAEVTVVEREEGEGTMAFYARVVAAAAGKRCVLRSEEGLAECRGAVEALREVVVMCGELDDEERVARGLAEGANAFKGKVVVANLRGYERKKVERPVEGWEEGRTMRVVRGWDVVDLLAGA